MTDKNKDELRFDFGFGNVFRGIGNFLDLLSLMAEEGKEEITQTKEFHGKGELKDLKGVYGFSVRLGLGGTPSVETFGNIRQTEAGPKVEEIREPLVDIFDEGDIVLVLGELPGVEESDVHLELKDDILTISAEGKDRKYSKEVMLPSTVKADTMSRSFKNGILEVKFAKEEAD